MKLKQKIKKFLLDEFNSPCKYCKFQDSCLNDAFEKFMLDDVAADKLAQNIIKIITKYILNTISIKHSKYDLNELILNEYIKLMFGDKLKGAKNETSS